MKKMQEAIQHYKYGIKCDIFSEPVITYAKIAIESIEKQIPKKPIVQKRRIFDCINQIQIYNVTLCPTCGKVLYTQFREYPCKCGQMIDWSEY